MANMVICINRDFMRVHPGCKMGITAGMFLHAVRNLQNGHRLFDGPGIGPDLNTIVGYNIKRLQQPWI
jgi:hypothetical protein